MTTFTRKNLADQIRTGFTFLDIRLQTVSYDDEENRMIDLFGSHNKRLLLVHCDDDPHVSEKITIAQNNYSRNSLKTNVLVTNISKMARDVPVYLLISNNDVYNLIEK
ncbi:8078_t:CDS:2, partial [Dentiscutata erythropus]